jgi:hypothetical protein
MIIDSKEKPNSDYRNYRLAPIRLINYTQQLSFQSGVNKMSAAVVLQ